MGLPDFCSMDDHLGAIPLAVFHLVNQSINKDSMAAGLPIVCSVDDHVCSIPLAVLHLDNQ